MAGGQNIRISIVIILAACCLTKFASTATGDRASSTYTCQSHEYARIKQTNSSSVSYYNSDCEMMCNKAPDCLYYVTVGTSNCSLYGAEPMIVPDSKAEGVILTLCKREYVNMSTGNCVNDEASSWSKNFDAFNIFDGNLSTCFTTSVPVKIQVPDSLRSMWITIKSNVTTCAPQGGLAVYEVGCDGAPCQTSPCYAKAEDMPECNPADKNTSPDPACSLTQCSFFCNVQYTNRAVFIELKNRNGEAHKVCSSFVQ